MKSSLLLKKSENFKKRADSLLKESGLIEFLSKYGKPQFTGSYELDLMMSGDIDIHVINTHLNKEKVIEILIELIRKGFFRGYIFYDFVANRRAGFPVGYYIGLKKGGGEYKWKIDIWFLTKTVAKQDRFIDAIRKRLNEKTRLKILELKYKKYKKTSDVLSMEIYKKVFKISSGA